MKYVIKGVRPTSFEDERTGELIEGVSLHCIHNDCDVFGEAVEKIFVRTDKPYYLQIKSYVENIDKNKTPLDLVGLTLNIDRGKTGKIVEFNIDFNNAKDVEHSLVVDAVPDISPKSIENKEDKKVH